MLVGERPGSGADLRDDRVGDRHGEPRQIDREGCVAGSDTGSPGSFKEPPAYLVKLPDVAPTKAEARLSRQLPDILVLARPRDKGQAARLVSPPRAAPSVPRVCRVHSAADQSGDILAILSSECAGRSGPPERSHRVGPRESAVVDHDDEESSA
jgi:hypothetical protein